VYNSVRVVNFFNFVLRNLKQKLDGITDTYIICDFKLIPYNRIYSHGKNTSSTKYDK